MVPDKQSGRIEQYLNKQLAHTHAHIPPSSGASGVQTMTTLVSLSNTQPMPPSCTYARRSAVSTQLHLAARPLCAQQPQAMPFVLNYLI